ncbi:MAG: ATP-binding protein [Clostridiales bacterium]|jgi:serine/threonine-protein kinase RsbW|nr:ATP-binding protein [Clostridiales bacterium]
MNNANALNESIQLSLPTNAAYVSAARLTASSIANRMVFDIDEIEDIKAAVSEACTFVIKNLPQQTQDCFKIVFGIAKESLTVTISVSASLPVSALREEIGIVMIKALVDELRLPGSDSDRFKIEMTKRHKKTAFD